MNHRLLASLSSVGALVMLAAPLPGQTPDPSKPAAAKSAPASKSKSWTTPRTPDGHPDLQGVWTNVTLTPMARPAQFKDKPTVSDAEAHAYETKELETNNIDRDDAPILRAINGANAVAGYNNLFIDRGSELARVDGVKRTSLIVDPPDGRTPR